jgi:hypothetical protein
LLPILNVGLLLTERRIRNLSKRSKPTFKIGSKPKFNSKLPGRTAQ